MSHARRDRESYTPRVDDRRRAQWYVVRQFVLGFLLGAPFAFALPYLFPGRRDDPGQLVLFALAMGFVYVAAFSGATRLIRWWDARRSS